MSDANLLVTCATAFAAVFVLLAGLALAIQLVTILFPERPAKTDAAVLAAISVAVSANFAGTTVSRIEEQS